MSGAQEGNNNHERDREWLRRIARGDQAAFKDLFQAYASVMANFAYYYIRSRSGAQDVVQDVTDSRTRFIHSGTHFIHIKRCFIRSGARFVVTKPLFMEKRLGPELIKRVPKSIQPVPE